MLLRPGIGELGLDTGKKARLHRILYQFGLRNGTALFLPYDQGLEHGPRDFFANPAAERPGLHRQARAGGRVQRHRRPDRPGGEVLLGLRGRGAADPEAERQDRNPGRRRGPVTACRRRVDRRRPAGRGRRRVHPVCRDPGGRGGLRPVPAGPRGRTAAGHAADRVGLPARSGDRGQGRQGVLLRRRLRGTHRQRTGRRRGKGELPAPGEADRCAARLRCRILRSAGHRRGGAVGEPDPAAYLRGRAGG